MSCDDQNGQVCGVCLPNKDPIFISAQVFSIIAIFFCWGFWLTGILGLAAFIMLQVAWCCRMNKAGIITAGVFACLDAVGCLIVGIVLFAIVASWDDDNYYYSGYDSYYYSSYDDYNDYYILLYIDEDAATIWAVVCFIGASLWIAVAVCCFMFACCRINRYNRQNQSEGTDTSSKQAVVVASPEDQLVAAKSTAEKPDETESTHHEQPSEKKNTSGQGEEAC